MTFHSQSMCFSALHHRGQLEFTEIVMGVIGSLALGIEVALRVLDYTKCGAYKHQYTKEIIYTRTLPPNGCFPKFTI